MDQRNKQPLITKPLLIVCGSVLLLFAAIAYVGFRLAQRDATFEADFWFKWFGASAVIFFALVGPFGLIGLWSLGALGTNNRQAMLEKIGNMQNSPEQLAKVREKVLRGDSGGGLVYRLIIAAVASLVLTAWALQELDAYSLFF